MNKATNFSYKEILFFWDPTVRSKTVEVGNTITDESGFPAVNSWFYEARNELNFCLLLMFALSRARTWAVNINQNTKYPLQMPLTTQEEFLQQLKADYRLILLNYFTNDITVKQQIDKFINVVFNAKIPVPQVIEIHMELIDDFAKQLKLEGRNDEILLDYRITLIDVLAHLCETYRCSLP